MRLYFASCFFPPTRTARAMQVARLARNIDMRPIVVCGDLSLPKDKDLESGIDKILQVKRFVVTDRQRTLAKKIMQIPIFHSIPDEWIGWARQAQKWLLKKERIQSQDILVTFAVPMSSHILGMNIKKLTGAKWIAHYSDPWLENPYTHFKPRQKRHFLKMEAKIVAAADRLLFTNQETLDIVMEKYPAVLKQKASVMHHYFDPNQYDQQYVHDNTKPYTIRYTGKLYGPRNEVPLAMGIKTLFTKHPELRRRLCFEFVGGSSSKHHDETAKMLANQGVIKFLKPVSYPESFRLMSTSAALLTLDAPFQKNLFLPSKLVDYLGARRPILCISTEGPSAKLVREFGGYVASPFEPEAIADEIRRLILWLDENGNSPWLTPEQISGYSIDTMGRHLMKIIKSTAEYPNQSSFRSIAVTGADDQHTSAQAH